MSDKSNKNAETAKGQCLIYLASYGLDVKSRYVIGAQLREARLQLGMSQYAIAVCCGVVRDTWARYERGTAWPDSEVWATLTVMVSM